VRLARSTRATLALLCCFAAIAAPLGARAQALPEAQAIVDPRGVLAGFRASLLRARGGGMARVLYIGDSAVVGDGITGELRRRLQARYGDGGHGFLLTGRPWPWYIHQNVRHDGAGWDYNGIVRAASDAHRLFGLAFVRASSALHATATWGTAQNGPVGQRVSRFEIFYLAQPGGGSFRVRVDGGAPRTIATAAETRRAAYEVVQVPDGPHELAVETASDGPVDVYGASLERASGAVVDALGVNGAHSIHFLRADAAMLNEHLRHRPPALFAIQIGTNMSNGLRPTTHGNRLAAFVRRMQAAAPDAACLLVTPPDRARRQPDGTEGTASYIPAIAAQTERVARETGCAFWSAYDAMGGSGSFVRWKALDLAAADDSHLTRAGYARLARMLDHALTGDRVE